MSAKLKPNVLMECGCSNSGTYLVTPNDALPREQWTERPYCGIHRCDKVLEVVPDLFGRKANCVYGQHALVDSDQSLPFFKYTPDADTDNYYCGCFGWD